MLTPRQMPRFITPDIYKKAEQYGVGQPVKHYIDWLLLLCLIPLLVLASAAFYMAFRATLLQDHIDNYKRGYIEGYLQSYNKDTGSIQAEAKANAEKAMSANPEVSAWKGQRNTAIIWCVSLYLLAFIPIISRFLTYHENLYLCSEGLLFVSYFGKKARVIRWDEVMEVDTSSSRAYILRSGDGSEFRISKVFVYGKLRQAIEQLRT